MSKIAISPGATGDAVFTLQAPSTETSRTLTLPDNSGTLLSNASTFAGTGPAFIAVQTVAVNPASNTATKITINVAINDTNSNFSTANNRFTPTVAGFYQVNASAIMQGSSGTNLADLTILKNGGTGINGNLFYDAGAVITVLTQVASGLIYMNGTTDYLEVFGRVIGSGTLSLSSGVFSGSLVRAA